MMHARMQDDALSASYIIRRQHNTIHMLIGNEADFKFHSHLAWGSTEARATFPHLEIR